MGMAASQARLLFITARLHDVELRAQQIQAAKIQLAIQSDAAYEKYNAALDGTTMTVNKMDFKSGQNQTIPATFNNLTGLGGVTNMSTNRYAIYENDKLLLSQDCFEGWNDYKDMVRSDEIPESAEMYALVMMGLGADQSKEDIQAAEEAAFETECSKATKNAHDNIIDWLNANKRTEKFDTGNKDANGQPISEEREVADATSIYDTSVLAQDADRNTYEELMDQYRHYLYNDKGEEIFAELGLEKFDEEEFDYYTDLYAQIKDAEENHKGVKTVDPTVDDDTEWLTNGVQSGNLTIATWNESSKKSELFKGTDFTSAATDSGLSYTQDQEIDEQAMKKAEAEYEHTLKQIDNKDKKFDMELAKLDTERNALTTMYDSVKKVIQDNVERTFGIFS